MNQHIPINREQITQLSEAYARFVFLRNATIKQPKDDAELRGLTEFMAQFFIDHASEFIGSWYAVRNEYEPLIGLITQIARRAHGLMKHQDALAEQQQSAEPPSNIIPVKS